MTKTEKAHAHLWGRQEVSKEACTKHSGQWRECPKEDNTRAMTEAEVLRELEGGICFIWGGQGLHLWGE